MKVIERASATAAYGGASSAFVFGLSPGEWQAIGVLAGVVIGIAGLVVNAFFQWKRFEMDLRSRK